MRRWSDVWPKGAGRQEEAAGKAAPDVGPRRFRLSETQVQTMRYLAVLLLAGIVLMSLNVRPRSTPAPADRGGPAVEPAGAAPGPAADFARALERQVEEALRQLHGVGRVHVSVTLATGSELVIAEQRTTEKRTSQGAGGEQVITDERMSAQPVLVRSDQSRQEQPIVLLEKAPVIQGVLVVTDAAADSRMRYELTRSVTTLLNVPAHRVYVLPQQW